MDPEPQFGESKRLIIVINERVGETGENPVIIGTFDTVRECCDHIASLSLCRRTSRQIQSQLQSVDYMKCGDIYVREHPFYLRYGLPEIREEMFSICDPMDYPDFYHDTDDSVPHRGFWGFRDWVHQLKRDEDAERKAFFEKFMAEREKENKCSSQQTS